MTIEDITQDVYDLAKSKGLLFNELYKNDYLKNYFVNYNMFDKQEDYANCVLEKTIELYKKIY